MLRFWGEEIPNKKQYKPLISNFKMKKAFLVFAAMVALVACNKEQKQEETTPEITQETVEQPKECAVLRSYVSEDGTMQFNVLEENLEAETIKVMDVKNNATYDLTRVESASGAKYADEAGNALWFKGEEEFHFFQKNEKGEETLVCSGKMQAKACDKCPEKAAQEEAKK